jgi:hypothetical protein
LEAGLEPSLQAECSREGLCGVTTLKDWIKHVKKVDECLTFDRKRYREIFIEEASIRASKHLALGNSHLPNAPAASTSSYSGTSSRDKVFICLPKLTDAEKDLLCAHSGCFKCRRFNARHGSNLSTCPGFPSSNGYKTITKFSDAIGHPAVKASSSTSSSATKGKTIASLIEVTESDEDKIVAAFAPSAVLGNGTNLGESGTVSDLAPLKCKNFIWRCFVDGPSTEFPIKFLSLINNGCHLVLIRPDVVKKLGLPTFTLPSPEPIDVAIKDSKKKKKMVLESFVIVKATSIDQV